MRDRASYEFALVSVAAALDLGGGTIRQARLALGGVGTKPWRCEKAEAQLSGASASTEVFQQAAQTALQGATAYEHNGFKIELARRAIVRTLSTLADAGGR